MRIAVSASGPGLNAPVDPRFGRCPYFVVVDSETMEWEAIDNANAATAGGAGIRTAQVIADQGVQTVITGNCGPNAYQTLSAAGIEVASGFTGSVQEAVEAYERGGLRPTAQANVASHYGARTPTGRGMGRGMGQGMGRGLGRSAMGAVSPSASADPLMDLAEQLRALTREIEGLSDRLEKLERKDT